MGGTITIQGNTNPHQEANFRHDPFSTKHALALAERQRIPVVLVPLDVSEQEGVLFTADRIRFLRDRVKSTYAMRVIEGVAGPESAYGSFYFNRTYHSPVFPYTVLHYKGVPLHDVTAAVIQDDFHDGATIFSYGPLDAQVNELGELGVARKYMQPHNAVIVTGPLKNYDDHWRRIVDRLQAYASCT